MRVWQRSLRLISSEVSGHNATTSYAKSAAICTKGLLLAPTFLFVALDLGVEAVALTTGRPAASAGSYLLAAAVALVDDLDHLGEVVLHGAQHGQEGRRAEAVGQQAEVGQGHLHLVVQDGGGSRVADGGAVLVQQVLELLDQLSVDPNRTKMQ